MEGDVPPAEPVPSSRLRAGLARRILLGVCLAAAIGVALFFGTLPDVRPLRREMPRTTAFMERRKLDLQRQGLATKLEWSPVPLARIAPSMQRAVVVAEDARFWKHEGVDWEAVRKALEEDLDEGGVRRGASTITQQLAKNLYLSSSRRPWRKLREWAIARKLERELTKQRILELYLNVIEFGQRTYGVEAAARRYFGKPASRLTPREAATLAAVIPSPRIYDPVRHPRRVARRANQILRWMGTWRRYPQAAGGAAVPTAEPSLPPIPGVAQETLTPLIPR
ncbi:MAG: monofunctional biosynthetic peptidoglycan transglycosylase [Thermoanaerobaculia bacterium]|nr:monofunctional biosynthetic peptidoglycan transglycosylase [Thermoanaerobaculia bacterium]